VQERGIIMPRYPHACGARSGLRRQHPDLDGQARLRRARRDRRVGKKDGNAVPRHMSVQPAQKVELLDKQAVIVRRSTPNSGYPAFDARTDSPQAHPRGLDHGCQGDRGGGPPFRVSADEVCPRMRRSIMINLLFCVRRCCRRGKELRIMRKSGRRSVGTNVRRLRLSLFERG